MQSENIEFSQSEHHVLDHFRPSAVGKWRRAAIFDLSIIVISLALGAVYLIHGDAGAGFVAYALVFWRAWSAFWQRRRSAGVYRSIFTKYQTRLEELERRSASPPKVYPDDGN